MKATRTILSIATTLTLGLLAGVMLWATGAFFAAGTYGIAAGGVFATVAMLTLFSVSLQESSRRLRKRGYARPTASGNVFESVARVLHRDAHLVNVREVIPVRFDDGVVIGVDVTELYYTLIRDNKHPTVLSWHRWRDKLDHHQWRAYRHLLEKAGAVRIDGRGAMRLNCTPWAAVERVRNT
jgi:hypothetical protein